MPTNTAQTSMEVRCRAEDFMASKARPVANVFLFSLWSVEGLCTVWGLGLEARSSLVDVAIWYSGFPELELRVQGGGFRALGLRTA